MTREQRLEPRQTFLVEHYRPGRDVAQLNSSIARIREVVAEMERSGEPVRYLSATIVPGDVPFERISAAICVLDEGESP